MSERVSGSVGVRVRRLLKAAARASEKSTKLCSSSDVSVGSSHVVLHFGYGVFQLAVNVNLKFHWSMKTETET